MDLAILHPVPAPAYAARAYRDEPALLGACLQRDGHTVALEVTTPETTDILAEAVAESRPDLVLMYVEGLAADAAVRDAGTVASSLGVPLVVFGPHARRCPDACLSLPGAEAVAVADAPRTVPAYVEARGARIDSIRTAGMWVTCETGVMRNAGPPPPESLADEPLPLRHLYGSEQTLDAAGLAPVVAARGGEAAEASAPGGETAPMPAPGGGPASWPLLYRPLDAILEEMRGVADEQLDLGGWRIGNTRWASDADWLAGFAGRYPREVRLPFRATLHAPDVTEETAGLLARAGAEEVTLPLGSASHLIRTEALGLDVMPDEVAEAVGHLRGAGVRSAVRVDVGAPYETPVTLDETVAVLRRIDPDRVEARLHWPAPGSPAETIAREHGWLAPDPAAAYVAGEPAVRPPSLSVEAIVEARDLMPYAVLRPGIMPLLRLSRRVRIPWKGTAWAHVVRPLLAPPVRKE
jgi:hypothetical protein